MKRTLPFLAVALLAGCGGSSNVSESSTSNGAPTTGGSPTTTVSEQRRSLVLYLIDPSDHKLVAVTRSVE